MRPFGAAGDEPFLHLLSLPRSRRVLRKERYRAGKETDRGETGRQRAAAVWERHLFKVVPKGPGGSVCLLFLISNVTL